MATKTHTFGDDLKMLVEELKTGELLWGRSACHPSRISQTKHIHKTDPIRRAIKYPRLDQLDHERQD